MPKSRRKIALLIVAVTGIVVMGVILWPGLSNYCRKQGMVWMLTWSVEEWNGWRGRGTEIDLTGVDLSGADLGNADLHSVNLSGADLIAGRTSTTPTGGRWGRRFEIGRSESHGGISNGVTPMHYLEGILVRRSRRNESHRR